QRDLLPGLLQHPNEPLVLLERLDEASLHLAQPLFQETDRPRLAAPEGVLRGSPKLLTELVELALDVVEASFVSVGRSHVTLLSEGVASLHPGRRLPSIGSAPDLSVLSQVTIGCVLLVPRPSRRIPLAVMVRAFDDVFAVPTHA